MTQTIEPETAEASALVETGTVKSNSDLAPPPESMEGNMMSVIARAASSKDVDVDKMERLLEMQQKLIDEESRKSANRDLFLLKRDCPPIKKGRGIKVRGNLQSTYAAYEDILAVVRPIMTQYGFAERFDTATDDTGVITSVTCTIVHRDGYSWDSTFPVTPDRSGNKNDIQGIGSALSYGKRYSLGAALGLVFCDEDDDGHGTTPPATTTFEPAPHGSPEPPAKRPKQIAESREQMIAGIQQQIERDKLTDGDVDDALTNLLSERVTDWTTTKDSVLKHLRTEEGWQKVLNLIQGEAA